MTVLLSMVFLLFSTSVIAQNPWQSVDESTIQGKKNYQRLTVPSKYQTFSLDKDLLAEQLIGAPMEDLQNSRKKGVDITLPNADGKLMTLSFVESPCMSPVLAAKYPEIKSYSGYDHITGSRARIDINPNGFRAIIVSPKGTIYIDPYYDQQDGHYIVYYIADDIKDTYQMEQTCGVNSYEESMAKEIGLKRDPKTSLKKRNTEPVIKTTYRFALACTGAWGSLKGDQDVPKVLGIMVSAVNRLNSLLEDEVAVKLELVDNNDLLIFFNDNEPYSVPSLGGSCLRENGGIISPIIGFGNYDIGHVFTIRCSDVGGVANGSSVCTTQKANGVSCVGNANIDNFMVSTTAHEVGHQFSAGHTWQNCPGIEGQFASPSSCEVGSGRTILSYYGACGSNNQSGGEVPLYHVCTLDQYFDFVTDGSGSSCGEKEETDNHHPDVWIVDQGGVTIPRFTPFELTGDAMDIDGDEMIYSWEQIDRTSTVTDINAPQGTTSGARPLFTYKEPSEEKTRLFPNLSLILAQRDDREERLPIIDRELNFAFVARDDNPIAGGVSWETIKFRATESAGPFQVTQPAQRLTYEAGDSMLVEWTVNNTDQAPVDCQHVDIYMSDDNAKTFPTLILPRTPNDGSEWISLPHLPTQNGKIKVKASESIFFNISRNNFIVETPSEASFLLGVEEAKFDFCLPASLETTITSETFLGFSGMIELDIVDGLPADATFEFGTNPLPAGESTSLNVDMSDVLAGGVYNMRVRGVSGTDTTYQYVSVSALGEFLGDMALTTPADGSTGLTALPTFEWTGSVNATNYRLQVATNPSFENDVLLINRDTDLGTSVSPFAGLENNTLYYWRVVIDNSCGNTENSEVFTFSSQSLSCGEFATLDVPLDIPSSGTPTVTAGIEFLSGGNVSDVNVKLIKGNHRSLRDLRGTLISPSGTRVVLWQGECPSISTLDAGFDDESPFSNGCPNRNGQKIQPREPLSAFIGEEIQGEWALEIYDIVPTNGGEITLFELEMCSNVALNSPFVVNNEGLCAPPSGANRIFSPNLLCGDDDNTAAELLYTIVESTSYGTLTLNGDVLLAGGQFTQVDIDNGALRYEHNGSAETQDNFVFTVIDGQGGWVDKTTFPITIESGCVSSSEDILATKDVFDIYPNPVNNILYIRSQSQDGSEWNYEFRTYDGKIISKNSFTNEYEIGVSNLPSGVYFLNIHDGERVVHEKVSIMH